MIRLRRTQPDAPRPFRMWLYPVPALVALAGWIFVFATSGGEVIGFGLATLGARRRRVSVVADEESRRLEAAT